MKVDAHGRHHHQCVIPILRVVFQSSRPMVQMIHKIPICNTNVSTNNQIRRSFFSTANAAMVATKYMPPTTDKNIHGPVYFSKNKVTIKCHFLHTAQKKNGTYRRFNPGSAVRRSFPKCSAETAAFRRLNTGTAKFDFQPLVATPTRTNFFGRKLRFPSVRCNRCRRNAHTASFPQGGVQRFSCLLRISLRFQSEIFWDSLLCS